MPETLKLTQLRVRNFKRIEAIDLAPMNRSLVVLRGPNEQGKTSAIDAIKAALCGKRAAPERPIRTGQDAAVVELTLSENLAPRYRVLRSWRANGDEAETRLTVYALDAEHKATIQSPQTVLDRLIGDLAFDPLAFVRADAREQVRLLLKAAGLEQQYAAAQRDRKAAYDQRTAVNAQLKQAEATMPVDPAPGETIEERTDADLRRLAAEINRHNAEVDLAERNLAQAAKAAETAADRVKRLEAELADARRDSANASAACSAAQKKRDEIGPRRDTAEIIAQTRATNEHNARARQQRQHRQCAAAVAELRQKSQALSTRIEAIDAELASLPARTNIGERIPGLTITEAGIQHNGVPLSQASGMRRLELSCLIGMAANPTLRVMTIDEGDQLDDAAIARLQEIATANDYQVWLTGIRVPGQTTDTLFVADLADGHVAGNTTPPSETPETPTPNQTKTAAAVATADDFDL